jgi:REP-associated tyrosine transposase
MITTGVQKNGTLPFVQCLHACDLRRCDRSRGHGHIFQRRYWNKPVEGNGYLMTVMKYVEANPVRAGLTDWAHKWEWSSMWDRVTGERDLLHPSPVWLPDDWPTVVTVPLQRVDLDRIRRPIKRGRPIPEDDLRIS